MAKHYTRPDPVSANPRVPYEPKLKLSWTFDGERLTGRWIETQGEPPTRAIRLPHVA